MTKTVEKTLCYVTYGDRLLVFRHLDYPDTEVGLQVPGGTIKVGESPEHAIVREVKEETDLEISNPRLLGVSEYNLFPYRDEVQMRHIFHVEFIGVIEEKWESQELLHDGLKEPTRLQCFWIPLVHGHVLQSGQGALLHAI
jgi:ADP-ribose pyrophosphatase YjhB (NUDIX family)